MKIQHTVSIDARIGDVFAYVTNSDNEKVWQKNVIEAKITSESPMGLDTTGYEVRVLFGLQFRSEWMITDFNPPYRLIFKSTSAFIPFVSTYTFKESEDTTIFRYRFETESGGFLGLIDPLLSRYYLSGLRADLDNLKSILEEKPSEYLYF
jgi:hypothetical protein